MNGYLGPDEQLMMEDKFEEQTERDLRIASRVDSTRFEEMPLQCDDCGKIEEPGEAFEDDWVSDVLCAACIERRMENEEIF